MIEYERIATILEGIAKDYPDDSDESQAIKSAALALFYVRSENIKAKFEKFLEDFEEELTDSQIAHLKNMGLSPTDD